MFDSKALKDFPKKESSRLYIWWIETRIFKVYEDLTWKFFGKPWTHVKKMWGWYWNVFRFDFDFDGHSLFAIIEYKLKRVEKSLINGCAHQEDQDMKALALAIKLAGRLKDDNYDIVGYDRIEKKYGELKTWFTDSKTHPGYSTWNSSRPKADTPEKKEELQTFTNEQYKLAENRKKRDEKNLYGILNKYIRRWWD